MKTLLTVELLADHHEKYLGPQFKNAHVLPALAQQFGLALLEAGALCITDHGAASPADERDGYHRFSVRAVILNPLASLATADLTNEHIEVFHRH